MTEQDNREQEQNSPSEFGWLERVSRAVDKVARAADRGMRYAGKRLTGFECAMVGMLTVMAIRGSGLWMAALGVLAVMEIAVIVSAAVWNDGGSDDE